MKRGESIRLAGAFFIAVALLLLMPCLSFAGSLEPSDPPGPTMKTLDQIPPTWSQRLPASERFQGVFEYEDVCYIGGHPYPCTKYDAVLDKETGLVWQRDLSTTEKVCWYEAAEYCCDLTLGGRKGWRLPTIQELASLIDPTQTNPALPSGHPFTNILPYEYGVWPAYWSATSRWTGTSEEGTNFARVMSIGSGLVYWEWKQNCYYAAWCVRSGQGVDLQ